MTGKVSEMSHFLDHQPHFGPFLRLMSHFLDHQPQLEGRWQYQQGQQCQHSQGQQL